MTITFEATEDIQKGETVILDFVTGQLSVVRDEELLIEPDLQPKEEPNIVEGEN
jgi:hypothetical protein